MHKKEHPALPNHLCDSLLYAWRNTYHYHASPIEKVIPVGSREWYQKQADDLWEKEREHLADQTNSGWSEFADAEDPAMKVLRKFGI